MIVFFIRSQADGLLFVATIKYRYTKGTMFGTSFQKKKFDTPPQGDSWLTELAGVVSGAKGEPMGVFAEEGADDFFSNMSNPTSTQREDTQGSWQSLQEGQLAVDVYEREDALVIRALVAGVNPEDLDIAVNGDMLTIRGQRQDCDDLYDDQFYFRECYWGDFSRTIILPVQVQAERVKAFFKNGVVTIVLPKFSQKTSVRIMTEDDYLGGE